MPTEDRPDVPRVGLFNRHLDAMNEAARRADLVGIRYRVTYERANAWWQISEAYPPVQLPGHRRFGQP